MRGFIGNARLNFVGVFPYTARTPRGKGQPHSRPRAYGGESEPS